MKRKYFILFTLIIGSIVSGCAGNAAAQANQELSIPAAKRIESTSTPALNSGAPSAGCPLTTPQDPPFVPPPPYDKLGFEGEFWYGSPALWTAVRHNGTWEALPHNPEGYTQKVFWWRDDYVWVNEPEPALIVTAERLDVKAPPVNASKATNAYASDIGSAMLVGVDLPSLGCWKITGKYGQTELSFVVRVVP